MLYRNRRLLWPHRIRVEMMPGPLNAYETAVNRVVAFARRTTKSVQAGALSHYVFVVLVATAALLWWKFFRFAGWPTLRDTAGSWAWSPALATVLMAGGGLVAAIARTRLRVLLALGVVGSSIAWLFAFYSAPDLALTQLLVEALTVVLMVIMLRKLPLRSDPVAPWRRWRDAVVSVAIGSGFALLVLSGIELQLAETISGQLAAWSYPEAYGRNVVNVILVDFRALDTFGEIIVLAIAGLGVHALLRRKPDDKKGGAS
jgi:multicomponent Na+:H+ antiporter subunit A